jgi:SnoaL-like domain
VADSTLEDRLRAVEDKLAIMHLIASHPPAADSGSDSFYRDAFTADGVVDLGGGKTADGNTAIAAMVKTPEYQAAITGGLSHFPGLPRIEFDGDDATAISYLQIITPDKDGTPRELSGHGVSGGFRIHRVGANRWELKRTAEGWKVTRRTVRSMAARESAPCCVRPCYQPGRDSRRSTASACSRASANTSIIVVMKVRTRPKPTDSRGRSEASSGSVVIVL